MLYRLDAPDGVSDLHHVATRYQVLEQG